MSFAWTAGTLMLLAVLIEGGYLAGRRVHRRLDAIEGKVAENLIILVDHDKLIHELGHHIVAIEVVRDSNFASLADAEQQLRAHSVALRAILRSQYDAAAQLVIHASKFRDANNRDLTRLMESERPDRGDVCPACKSGNVEFLSAGSSSRLCDDCRTTWVPLGGALPGTGME